MSGGKFIYFLLNVIINKHITNLQINKWKPDGCAKCPPSPTPPFSLKTCLSNVWQENMSFTALFVLCFPCETVRVPLLLPFPQTKQLVLSCCCWDYSTVTVVPTFHLLEFWYICIFYSIHEVKHTGTCKREASVETPMQPSTGRN